jgi:hypothetical protein
MGVCGGVPRAPDGAAAAGLGCGPDMEGTAWGWRTGTPCIPAPRQRNDIFKRSRKLTFHDDQCKLGAGLFPNSTSVHRGRVCAGLDG